MAIVLLCESAQQFRALMMILQYHLGAVASADNMTLEYQKSKGRKVFGNHFDS